MLQASGLGRVTGAITKEGKAGRRCRVKRKKGCGVEAELRHLGQRRRLVMNEQEVTMRRPMTRRHFLALSATGLAGTALLGATGRDVDAQLARRAAGSRSITLG